MSKDENQQSNISGNIDTDGGLVNSGSMNTNGGAVIGRDKIVYGDAVRGDKITNITRLDPSDARAQRNHAALRDAVRIFWVDGVLKNSLYNELLIRLDMAQQPDAVNNRPWNLILQQPEQPDLAIADDKQIIDIFKQMGQQMLILGEPGSGKTITLLTLADALLEETKADPTLPTPVVFNLSSWAEKQLPLDEWLVEELNQRYHMPRKVSQNWVENDELLLLLDGLDEVAADKRDACVSAINVFQKEHIVSVVVCSRIAEYQALTDRLNLTSAIAIRPLTHLQISDYIARADPHLAALNHALTNSPELRELAQTPLMLSIMTLTYHDQTEASQSAFIPDRSERQHLFDTYIRRMFQHRDLPYLYPPAKTLYWLQWLAEQMVKRSQTTFYIERLQPDWLGSKQNIMLQRLLSALIIGMYVGLLSGLIVGVYLGTVLIISSFGPLEALLLVLGAVLRITWIVGLFVGFMLALFGSNLSDIIVREEIKFSWRNLLVWFVIGLSAGLSIGLAAELSIGLFFGLFIGLSGGLFSGLQFGETELKINPNQGIRQSLKNGLILGLILLLISGLSGMALGYMMTLRWSTIPISKQSLIYVLVILFSGLIFGLIYGLIVGLRGGLFACIQHLALRIFLTISNHIPRNYAHFLDYAASRLFLRKVGGGYIFIHRMVLEHIAALTDADIARITAELEDR